jgi:hypothetical protein
MVGPGMTLEPRNQHGIAERGLNSIDTMDRRRRLA